jgi:hypothetical protein
LPVLTASEVWTHSVQGDTHETFCTVRSVRYCIDDGVHFVCCGKPADLCDANIQTIDNAKGQLSANPELSQRAETSVAKAKALKAQGKIDDCIAETSQTIVELRKSTGTNN